MMSRDMTNPHSGEASMELACVTWCTDVGAFTAAAFCRPIGAGPHPSSFWYRLAPSDPTGVALEAWFYAEPMCAGSPARISFSSWGTGNNEWAQVIGTLVAPAGTESASFHVLARKFECELWCYISVGFDDLDVESEPQASLVGSSEQPTRMGGF
jgi:hypothetical protein